MLVKILGSAGDDFHGVRYNEKKIDSGKGELMLMKNFPSFINEESNSEEVRNYLRSISKSDRVKKPQFHAVISSRFQEQTKEQLTETAEKFMDEMGYGKQPFLVIFHSDTENNHVHIVSTRVNKKSGRKINDSYEKLKAQKALAKVQKQIFGISHESTLNKLLSYRFASINQLETLLNRNGFRVATNKANENSIDLLKNGVIQKTLDIEKILFQDSDDLSRKKQIKAINSKYREICSPKVFKVEDNRKFEGLFEKQADSTPKIEFESEMQKKMRDVFGIDIVFHHKDFKKPFGCTIIDHKTGSVFKGSEIFKMNEMFEFTENTIDKRMFERLKDFSIRDEKEKEVMIKSLNDDSVKDFMVFENKFRKTKVIYQSIRKEVLEYLKNGQNDQISIVKNDDGDFYAIHHRYHHIQDLKSLVGEKIIEQIFYPEQNLQEAKGTFQKQESNLSKLIDELLKSSYTAKDPAEDALKKKRKKRK